MLVVCAFMGGMGVCRLLDGAGKGGLVITMELAGWLAAAALVVFLGFTRRRLRSIEDMLAESEQRFQLMADAAPAIIWTSVPDGACDYCNHAWFEFLGRHAQGTLGEAWGAAIHPDDFEATRKSYRDAVREHSDYRWEFRLRRHDGEYRWVLSFGAPRTGIDGEHAGYVGMCIDITEEKLQRHRLDEAKTKFETLARLAPVGIFHTAPDGACLYVNDRWCELAGLTPGQAHGHGWVGAVHPDDRQSTADSWYGAATVGREYYHENRFQRPDGSVVWLVARAQALRDEHGQITGHLGTCTDVTALKEAEEKLLDALRRQEAAAEREGLLRRELDHRVRNNLASLLGLIRLSEESPLDRRAVLARLRGAVRTMNDSHELISSAHGRAIRLDRLLDQLLRGPTSRTCGRVAMSGPEVRIAPERVNALAMALQELATNCAKHGALSGPEGRVDIAWTADEPDDGRVRITWTEMGCRSAAEPIEGTGLSLLKTLVAIDLEGAASFEFSPGGMTCTIDFQTHEKQPRAIALNGAERP